MRAVIKHMATIRDMKLTIFALRRARVALVSNPAREAVDVVRLIDEKSESLQSKIEQDVEMIP